MNIAIISFTNHGTKLSKEITTYLEQEGNSCESVGIKKYADLYGINPLEESLSEWTKKKFSQVQGLIFVGATGIAVRAIAPNLIDKTKDPAVVVIDEQGCYSISLLSGHLGGANELAITVAKAVNAVPIITTATDINHKFAVDVFAKKNNLAIKDGKIAKKIAAAVLENEVIGVYSDISIEGQLPSDLYLVQKFIEKEVLNRGNLNKRNLNNVDINNQNINMGNMGIYIGVWENSKPFQETLHLVPKILTLGIGCKKDTPYETIHNRVVDLLKQNNIAIEAIEQIASIDLKKNEAGLLKFGEEYHLPIIFFSKEELEEAKGEFTESLFVERVTGIGNVCERAAVLASNGRLIEEKNAGEGVTVALAIKEWSVEFE